MSLAVGTSEYPTLKYADAPGAIVTAVGAIEVNEYAPPRTTVVGRAVPFLS